MLQRQSRLAAPRSATLSQRLAAPTSIRQVGLGPSRILALQRAYGNQAVGRLLAQRRAAAEAERPGQSGVAVQQSDVAIQRKVGFEFQMLASEVELFKKNENLGLNVPLHWNNKQTWRMEKDGYNNIEFVMQPVDDPNVAAARVREIVDVAKKIKSKGTYVQDTGKAYNQTNRIKVNTPDTQGQPQINADISPDNLAGGQLGFDTANDTTTKVYFGAEYSGRWNWSYGQTKTQLVRIERIRSKMATFTAQDVLAQVQAQLGDTVSVADADATTLQAVERLVRSYCILEALIRETSSKSLTKDIPFLPKTNMSSLESEILARMKRGLKASNNYEDEVLDALMLNDKFASVIAALREASGSGKGDEDIWDTEDPERRFLYGVKEPKNVESKRNYSILIEYRRVPVKKVTEWEAFARQATTDLGTLG